jgi:hypothetical protein
MCIYKCMLNVYKNQQNRQTGSRNLTGPKTLPTIWHTYMKLVTKYQISAINSVCRLSLFLYTLNNICSFFVTFFSATIDGRNLIFGHKLHIGTPYRGKRFWTQNATHGRTEVKQYTPSPFGERGYNEGWLAWGLALLCIRIGLPPNWRLSNVQHNVILFADLVGLYTHWTYMHIFLSNYWWQRSDIWSQASYRYPISWEVFLDPSDSYFCLPT